MPLGERGHLFFDAPAEVSLVANRGLRIRCHAKLLWPVLGIDVAITVRSMTLLAVPSIESRHGDRTIVITPEVDAIDLAVLPDIADSELRAFLNRELQQKCIELPWNYKETLDHRFALPQWFRERSTFDIRSNGASVKVTNDSIGLAIGFHASVGRSEPPPLPTSSDDGSQQVVPDGGESTASASPTNGSSQSVTLMRRQRGSRKLVLGLAVAGGFGVGCLLGLWHTSRA